MGAWIEIRVARTTREPTDVAPHVGAWIEMEAAAERLVLLVSHPTWVRGLKCILRPILARPPGRTPRGCVD